eukprot:11041685-Alexandrium_andersonii.AAC.1
MITAAKLVCSSSEHVRETRGTRGPVLRDRSLPEFGANSKARYRASFSCEPGNHLSCRVVLLRIQK